MNTDVKMTRAMNFIANPLINTSEDRKTIDDHIRTLLQGDPADAHIGALLKKTLDYPGSLEGASAAFYICKSLGTAQGRKAAGLPPNKRGKSYRLQDIKRGEPIIKALAAQQLGGTTVQDVDTAVAEILGDNFDERTKKKLIAELMPRVIGDVYWSKRAQGYLVWKRSSTDGAYKTS